MATYIPSSHSPPIVGSSPRPVEGRVHLAVSLALYQERTSAWERKLMFAAPAGILVSHQPSGLWWCATMRMCTWSIRGKLAPRHEALKPDPVP